MDTFELDNRVIEAIIKSYTKESGVRSLEKKISKISRWVAKSIVKNEDYNSCLLYTSPSPRDATLSRMPSSA